MCKDPNTSVARPAPESFNPKGLSGLYQDDEGQAACKTCPSGKYQDGGERTACEECELGKAQGSGSQTICIVCTAPTVSRNTGRSVCEDGCEPGSSFFKIFF